MVLISESIYNKAKNHLSISDFSYTGWVKMATRYILMNIFFRAYNFMRKSMTRSFAIVLTVDISTLIQESSSEQ